MREVAAKGAYKELERYRPDEGTPPGATEQA